LNKLVSIKYTSAIFLTIVLVTGIIALSSQSFKTANALSSPLFTEENKYESTGYQPEYTGQKSNIYESTKYKMDRYEKPSYSNDNYQQQPEYSTYITNYESQYSSYGKDNNYKSKDSSSAIIKKINCNNINVNLNGLDINATAASGNGDTNDGAVEAASLMENGNANNGGYGERNNNYAQRGNDFTFVCINNNNNTVVEEDETPIPPVEDECAEDIEACFEEFLIEETLLALETALESQAGLTVEINGEDITLRSYADICLLLEGLTFDEISNVISTIISEATGIIVILPFDLIACIAEALGIPIVVPIPR